MNKKIRKHCKHSFNDDKVEQEWQKFIKHWFEIVHAVTRENYKLIWRNLKNKYERSHRDEILYLQKIWLDASWRRCFNDYHINDILHFNAHKSSRIEDDYRILKQMLKCFTDNMKLVIKRLKTLFLKQYKNYFEVVEQIKTKSAVTKFNRQFYRYLLIRITFHVLHRIEKQYRRDIKIKKKSNTHSLKRCIDIHNITTNISCAHTIRDILKQVEINWFENALLISLQLIHSHWRLLKFKFFFITSKSDIISFWESLITHVDSNSNSNISDKEKRFLNVKYEQWNSRKFQSRFASFVSSIDDESDVLNFDRALNNNDVVDADQNDDFVVNDDDVFDVDDDNEISIVDHLNDDVFSNSARVLDNDDVLNSAHDENNAFSSDHVDDIDNVMNVDHIFDADDVDVIENVMKIDDVLTNKKFAIIELKNKHRKSQSKDDTTIRIKRRKSKFIDRNSSDHESKLSNMTIRNKKTKSIEIKSTRKKIVKMTQSIETQNTLERDRDRDDRDRDDRDRDDRDRDVTRNKVMTEKSMKMLNVSFDNSDSVFEKKNDFDHLFNDDDYEDANDENHDSKLNMK